MTAHTFRPKLITADPKTATMICRRCGEWWDHPNHQVHLCTVAVTTDRGSRPEIVERDSGY